MIIDQFKSFITYLFFIIILLCHINASEFEEFYIFPMGQGNGQLIIYHQGEESIGVLYDLGSKSLQMHPKLASRGNWELNFLIRKEIEEEQGDISIDFDRMFSEEDENFETPVKPPRIVEPFSLNAKLSTPQREILKSELQLFIREKLINLKHLFIFLSHSDEDHINYINQETIPDELPITVFLAGDWFGNIGCKKDEKNITKSVKSVLIFLKNRIRNEHNTKFSFPYYMNFNIIKKDGELIDFNQFLKQNFLDCEDWEAFLKTLSQYCLRTNLNTPNPVFISNTFSHLYSLCFSNSEGEIIPVDDFMSDVIENIYIWSVNHQTDDINSHSMVVSCKLPNLNMSVIFTGDAQHSVFQRISSHYYGQNFRQILKLDEQHLITYMLPHHGSEENSSGSSLRFFTPDVFGIPAGDGGQYGHPSLSLIENINNIYGSMIIHSKFYQRYLSQKSLDFIAIQDSHQFLKQASDFSLPFLSTNLYGCIKWDKDGIYTNFRNIVEVGGFKYNILYSSHVWEANKGILKKIKKSSKEKINVLHPNNMNKSELMEIVEKSSKNPENYRCIIKNPKTKDLFAGIPVGDKLYFYQLILVP